MKLKNYHQLYGVAIELFVYEIYRCSLIEDRSLGIFCMSICLVHTLITMILIYNLVQKQKLRIEFLQFEGILSIFCSSIFIGFIALLLMLMPLIVLPFILNL